MSLSDTERKHAVNKAFNKAAGGCAAFATMASHCSNATGVEALAIVDCTDGRADGSVSAASRVPPAGQVAPTCATENIMAGLSDPAALRALRASLPRQDTASYPLNPDVLEKCSPVQV